MAGGYLKGDGIWGTAGNWSSAAIPTANDDAIIPKSLSSDVTDPGGTADGIDLDLLYLHRDYTGSFGTTGSPIETAADVAKLYSGGPVFFDCHDNGAAVKTDFLTAALAQATLIGEIGGAAGTAGDIDFMRFLRGRWTLKNSVLFGASGWVQVGYVNNPSNDCRLDIASGAPTLPLLRIWGGETISHNVLTTVYVAGGTLTKLTAQLSTAYIGPGGIIKYEHENADNVPDFHIAAGGTLDLLSNSVPKILGDCFVEPQGNLIYDPDLHTFSGTNGLVDMRDGVL